MPFIQGIHYYTLKGLIEGSGMENNSYALVEVDTLWTIRIKGFRKADSAELKHGNPWVR